MKGSGCNRRSSAACIRTDAGAVKLVRDFDQRFANGVPSLQKATSFVVGGDWTFEQGVEVVGSVELGDEGAKRVPAGQVLSGPDA